MKMIMLLFLGMASFSSQAQEGPKKDYTPPMLLRGLGISFQSFDGLNSRVANRPEYKQLKDYAGTIELGSMKVYKRFISDFDLIAASSMSGDRDRKSSTLRYAGVGIDFGYDLIPDNRIMLYPMAGVGFQGFMARFYRDNSQVPFDLVLASSGVQNDIRPVSFTNSFFTYRLGLGVSIKSPRNPSSSFGIHARYTGSFKDKAWKSSDGQELGNAPRDGVSQFQVALILTNAMRLMK